MAEALRGIGLAGVEGRDADTVFAAITNAIAPAGDSREAVAARQATNEVLDQLYVRFVGETGDFSRLEAMSAEDVATALERSIAAYVFNRWIGELGKKIEQKSVSPAQAVRFERDMRLFVDETVKLDFAGIDPLRFDWSGAAGRTLVERIYAQAYAVIGGER